MMTVQTVTYYRCDRCKKRFRRKGDVRKLLFDELCYSDDYCTRMADLCEDCQESFKRWLRGDAS